MVFGARTSRGEYQAGGLGVSRYPGILWSLLGKFTYVMICLEFVMQSSFFFRAFVAGFFPRTEYDASSRIEASTPGFATDPSFSKISRCGIHTGRVLVGNMGFHSRMKYGIVGDLVHLERLKPVIGLSALTIGPW